MSGQTEQLTLWTTAVNTLGRIFWAPELKRGLRAA